MSEPVILCILDGWGLSERTEANATLITHGPDVGLPRGQMGNSEVGHTNIGAGRVVAMDLGQIDLAIEDGSFFENKSLKDFIARMQASGGTAHLMGLVSDGGVHGHLNHILAATRAIAGAGVPVALHAITDGRDVLPKSARSFLERLESDLPPGVRIATVIGRYFALDRDNRWDRVQEAYEAMIHAKGARARTARTAVTNAYARSETDEFMTPTVIGDYPGAQDGDGFFCLNFRADRAREILCALAEPGFDAFDPGTRPDWAALLGMVEYSDLHTTFMHTVFPAREIVNTLGEWVAKQGKRQFHLAETEKYPMSPSP